MLFNRSKLICRSKIHLRLPQCAGAEPLSCFPNPREVNKQPSCCGTQVPRAGRSSDVKASGRSIGFTKETAMRAARFAQLWVLALAFPELSMAHAGTISGEFVLGGKAVPVHEVAAFRMRDQSNPRTVETYVMLTVKPVDRAAISASLDPYALAINDPAVRDDDYLSFNV